MSLVSMHSHVCNMNMYRHRIIIIHDCCLNSEIKVQMTQQMILYYGSQFNNVLIHFEKLNVDSKPFGEGRSTHFITSAHMTNYSGAFGVVYHAILTTEDGQLQEVAVKLAKGISVLKCVPLQ